MPLKDKEITFYSLKGKLGIVSNIDTHVTLCPYSQKAAESSPLKAWIRSAFPPLWP